MTTENPYGLPAELAKPVARGLLGEGEAVCALLVAALQRERVTPFGAADTYRGLRHLYRLHLERERMAMAIGAMKQRWAARENRHGR